MAERHHSGNEAGRNLPPLSLHVPEPHFRPGDEANFSTFDIPAADAAPRPDETAAASDMRDMAYGLVRVLDEDGQAVGNWNPNLPPETLRPEHPLVERAGQRHGAKHTEQGFGRSGRARPVSI